MNENIEDWIRKNVKCCACSGTLDMSDMSDVLNVCVTKKVATWLFPVFGDLECPGYPPKAMAFVCEECLNNKEKIRRVVEFNKGTPCQVMYHDIDNLEDVDEAMSKIKYYFGRKEGLSSAARNPGAPGLKAARERSVN